ncbi:MAG: methylenetetrahydrofolate--tRNA-(uracil(54)-C(5))-methyltransferase (FADH(2)-oxidizing) TrmFO [Myxococcales bacterium]|nr:methylenetetrahydrofolate--tRNA-(uracil(54)-C(5))-methyltransferase (FADH(2)-oxidizing) TrmFO [Myxococcales bacterium]
MNSMLPQVSVVGGGLAGSEAAWQLARRGLRVTLYEQKPLARTPAQTSDYLAEMVCSNSFRGASLSNAVGLLKEEMRRAGSLIMAAADATRVPAGGALAVDRERFGVAVTETLSGHPNITRVDGVVTRLPDARPVIVATGPLTGDALAADLAARLGQTQLAYYDAISPIIAADSINFEKAWRQSRYDKGGDDAYLNCALDEAEYAGFIDALDKADKVKARDFEEVRYFEGCLPIEVMAARGAQTLRYGPMKPVGLTNPHKKERPYAVVQLRQEDANGTAFNIVGFQTRMTYPAQAEVFRRIPGLEEAEFMRFGSVHRNTFVNAPKVLSPSLELHAAPGVFLAGQITGVEGYLESAACGLLAAVFLVASLRGEVRPDPPATSAFGGLLAHLRTPHDDFQPSNITWAHVPPFVGPLPRNMAKRDRYEKMAERGLGDLDAWLAVVEAGLGPPALSGL